MGYLKIIFTLSLALLIFAGCSKMEIEPEPLNAAEDISLKSADDAQYKGAMKHCVPFKANFQIFVAEVIHPGPPPPKILISKGTGKATHLGKTTVVLDQKWWPPGPPPYTFPWTGTGIGKITFTAANGDRLVAYYDDAKAIHLSEELVTVTLTGRFEDEGTGRFEHAEGEFDWEVIYNPVLNEGTVTVTGNIKYSKK